MDQIKIETSFMKNYLSEIAEKLLKKKLAHDISIQANGLSITNEAGRIHVHVDLDAEMNAVELKEMLDGMILWEEL